MWGLVCILSMDRLLVACRRNLCTHTAHCMIMSERTRTRCQHMYRRGCGRWQIVLRSKRDAYPCRLRVAPASRWENLLGFRHAVRLHLDHDVRAIVRAHTMHLVELMLYANDCMRGHFFVRHVRVFQDGGQGNNAWQWRPRSPSDISLCVQERSKVRV